MTCQCCSNARDGARLCTPACLWCGARLIQGIQAYRIDPAAKAQRCRTVLADWMAFGHSELELRRLAKLSEPAYAPESEPTLRKGKHG